MRVGGRQGWRKYCRSVGELEASRDGGNIVGLRESWKQAGMGEIRVGMGELEAGIDRGEKGEGQRKKLKGSVLLAIIPLLFLGSGSVTFTVTGSVDPTKLTQVTASLSAFAPSTAMVNIGGDEAWEVVEETLDVREEEKLWHDSMLRHGLKPTRNEGIWGQKGALITCSSNVLLTFAICLHLHSHTTPVHYSFRNL